MKTIKFPTGMALCLAMTGSLAMTAIAAAAAHPRNLPAERILHAAPQQPPATPHTSAPDLSAPGFKEFGDCVQDYIKLRKKVESSMPKLKKSNEPELIVAHQGAMARNIREGRAHAKRGDIFTPAAVDAFRQAISGEFQGPQAPNAKATMQQGAPLKEVHVRVNQVYPQSIPYTSVPPTLLQKLPKLPDEVAYRVVNKDLVLIDVKTNVVLDYIPGIIPALDSSGG